MKKTIINFDAITGEQTVIERDETAEEKKEREAVTKQIEEKQMLLNAEAEAKAQAKAQLLAQLGITEEQAKLLLS